MTNASIECSEHKGMNKFMSEFQLDLGQQTKVASVPKLDLSITVFKKKDLTKYAGVRKDAQAMNVYNHNLSHYDVERSGRSKVSCVRCRKFKKKCSRTIPECTNCLGSDDLCVYQARGKKPRKKSVDSPEISPASTGASLCQESAANYSYTSKKPGDFDFILN